MSNTDLMNLSAFDNEVPDAAFASLPQDESLADGIGQSYGVIGYKGKVWTLRYRGDTHQFTRPDDGSPAAYLDVVILRAAGWRSKSFYEGGFVDGNAGSRPTCSSNDGVNPDPDVQSPQSSACAICPRNEFKINTNGRKGKDCSDYKRLAVLVLPTQSAALFGGSPLIEPVFLRVPAASLNDLAILGEAMQKKGFPFSSFVTRIGFDITKPHPQMTFRALQKLSAAEAPTVLGLREDPIALRITGEQSLNKSAPQLVNKPATPTTTAQVEQPKVETPKVETPKVETPKVEAPVETEVERLRRLLAEAEKPKVEPESEVDRLKRQLAEATAKLATPTAEKNVETPKVEAQIIAPQKTASEGGASIFGGFGLGDNQPVVEVAQTSSGSATATANTEADTGPAEEADVDLDARVAGLLKR